METLQCRACNTPIPFGASFCGRCGKPLDVDQLASRQLLTELDPSTIITSDLSTRSEGWTWQQLDENATTPLSPEETLFPLLGTFIKPAPGSVPAVQGTPQPGGVPSLPGTPQAPSVSAPQAPWQQSPTSGGSVSPAPHAPSAPAPMNPHPVAKPHPQHHRWFRKRGSKPQHTPAHHLHPSGHLHDSGALHSASEARQKHGQGKHTKGLKRLGKWHPKSGIIAATSICVLGGLALLLIIPLLFGHAQTPPAALILNGNVVPGGNVSVQGHNFTPGGMVSFTMDGHLATVTGKASSVQVQNVSGTSSMTLVAVLAQQKVAGAGSAVMVKSDGSFQTTIQVDPQWPVGSSHLLIATEQSSNQQARLTLLVPHPAQLVDCASSTTATSIVLGPVPEGQSQPISTGFSLCTTGTGMVQWTASWNQQQAKWLQVDQTGNILAPLSRQLTIGASASGLKAGAYSAVVTFTDQSTLAKVVLNVTFIVRSAQATACLNTSTQSLTFSAAQGLISPAAQPVTLSNCGASGAWAATTHTDDGANWLSVNPANGQLNAKASSPVSISVVSSTLGQGIYTGQVTFKTGSGIAVVNVTLNVQASPQTPLCISAAPQSLTFSATQGLGNPGSQNVVVGNCGPASAWSAMPSTSDGANWLHVGTTSGNLAANASITVSIAVSSAQLQAGTYSGQVTFKMGSSSQTVNVALTVLQQQAKPCLSVSTQSLPFTATQGQGDPASQTVTLANCGPAGSWSASTVHGSNWLGFNSTGGTLNAGGTQDVTVNASISGLSAATYSDTITFALKTSSGTTTQSVSVTLTVQPPPPPPPCIHASTGSLSFTGTQGQGDPGTQTVILSNCGSDGTWTASTANGSGWLNINPTNNTLSAGGTQNVTVGALLSGLNANTYNDTITFTITTSTGTSHVNVAVSLVVVSPPPPCLQVSTGSLSFTGTQGQGDPGTQTVTLTNCGPAVSWTASTANGSGWLNISPTGNTLNAGGAQNVTVGVSLAGLNAGSYSETINFADSAGTVLTSVNVTLTVQPPPPPPCLQISSISPAPSTDGVVYVYPATPITVTVTNCGSDAGTLSTGASVNWLPSDLQAGTTLNAGGSLNITFTPSLTAPYNTTGTGTITLTTNGGQTSVSINVNVLTPIQ